MGRLILGLDIGITSVGYGVVDIDNNQFVDYGVRLFKEGTAADNEKRRASRGGRRLRRRKQTRLLDMKHYLEEVGIKEKEYTPLDNPYEIRKKGLSEKLSLQELTTALLHLTKNRGTTLEALESTTEDDEGTKSILNKNSLLLGDDKFICEVQLERLASEGKIRGIDNNFKTDDYIKEAKQILKNQDLSEEVINRIISILQRRRQYYEGPGSAKSPTIYGRWVDFGVEPIDLIEKMRGKCSIFPDELRAPKNCYTSELFNFLNDLNNLTIDNEKITTEQKEGILEIINSKGGMSIKDLTKFLDVPLEDIHGFRIDKNNKPLLTPFTGYKKFKKSFDTHHENCYVDDKSIIDNIADIVTSKKGITERFDAIKKKYPELSDDLILDLSNVKGITQYHSLSLKAMHMINEEMLKSPLNQMQILHQLDMMNKTRKSLKGEKKIYADDTAILSPVAKRAQRETFKVINALRDKYGEFESIVIEMTRDKNTQEQKKHIEERNKRNENNNKAVDALLKEKGFDPSLINGKTKMKVRLYMDQDGKTAYTLQSIDLNHLISDPTAFEIDHIIPISISLDDSYANKVLVTRTENQVKGNLTPIDAYLKGKFTGCDLNTYKTYTKSHHQYGQKKKGYLLYDKDITKFSNIQEFIARNLVDTSYACRVVLNTLQHYFRDNEIPTKVHTVKGTATHIFRKRIHLEKDREQDYLHHAIDALIIATIKKLPIYRNYLIKYDLDTLYNEKTGEFMHVGDNNEILDPMYIDFIHNLKKIHEESYQYYNGMIERKEMKFRPIKISHKVDTKPNRQISDETIYSTRNIDDEEKIVKKYKDIYDPQFSALTESIINNDKVDKWLMQRNDPETFEMIKKIILDHFNTYKDDPKIYSKDKKDHYKLKGSNNPLSIYKEEHGKVRKYSKKGNGPEITSMKYVDGVFNSGINISKNYETKNKKVVLLQVSPYRTDFYISPEGKYKFVTIRYNNVFYKKSIQKYVIDSTWYQEQKDKKGIDDFWQFVCSLHHDELIGIKKKDGTKYVYDSSTEGDGIQRTYHGEYEILKFTATNSDNANKIEVKPIYTYTKERLKPSMGTIVKLQKFSTDVLGNLYENKDNILHLEFD